MAKRETEEVATKTEEAAIEALPTFLAESRGLGTEGLTREDVRTPRLKLAQGLSPQMVKSDPGFIKGLTLGDAFNDLTSEIYGPGPFTMIVVRKDPPRWVEFDPDDRRVVVDRAVPAGDPRTQWTDDEKGRRQKPLATKFYDYVVLLGPGREPVALSFSSTGIATAQTINSFIGLVHRQTGRPLDIFAKRYEIASVERKNDKGTWYLWSVRQAGLVSEKEYAHARAVYDVFKTREVEFDRGPEDEADVPEAEDSM
jgi:hypothetical protein